MSDIVLNDVTNLNQLTVVNDNFDKIEQHLNDKALDRSAMKALQDDIDMNGNRIYNLPEPVSPNEPARLQDILDAANGVSNANAVNFSPYSDITATNVQLAIQQVRDKLVSTTPTATQVPFTPYGVASGTNVQTAIQQVIDNLGSGGGGGGYSPPVYGGLTVPDFVVNGSTPAQRVDVGSTNPNGWNTDVGKKTVQFDFVSTNYFTLCPNGHFGIICRADMRDNIIATAARGQGIWFGNLSGYSGTYMPQYSPAMGVETWFNGLQPSGNFVFATSTSPYNQLLQDNVTYRVIIDTSKQPNGLRYIRYQLYKQATEFSGATSSWLLVHDSGDVLDHNIWADLTQDGLVFAHVFPDTMSGWSVSFKNIKVIWGPAYQTTSTNTGSFTNTYGGVQRGDVNLSESGKRILVKSDGALSSAWTMFKAYTANTDTQVTAVPNGSGKAAAFLASTNDSGTNYNTFGIGVKDGSAFISSYAIGTNPVLPIDMYINGSRYARLSQTSFDVTGGITATGAATVGNLNSSGNITLTGTANKINFYSGGIDPAAWTQFKSTAANSTTLIPIVPNGTSTASGIYAFNTSNPTTSSYAVNTFGIQGANAVIEAFGVGQSNPPIKVNIGAGNTVATFRSDGLRMGTASTSIGTQVSTFTNMYGFGGTNARTFTDSVTFDWDAVCNIGTLASLMGATYNANNIENVLRPVYCMIGVMMGELRNNRKVF